MRARGTGPLVLVGHALGAWVAVAMARQLGAEVRGLIALDPSAGAGFASPDADTTGDAAEAADIRALVLTAADARAADWSALASEHRAVPLSVRSAELLREPSVRGVVAEIRAYLDARA